MLPIDEWFKKPINRTEKKVHIIQPSLQPVKPDAQDTEAVTQDADTAEDEAGVSVQPDDAVSAREDDLMTEAITSQIGSDVKDMLDMGKEDVLLAQIDEFREKAKQLQQLMSARENRARDLENKVQAKRQQEQELDQVIASRQKEAKRIMGRVSAKMDDMSENFRDDVKELTDPLMDKMDHMSGSLNTKMDHMSGSLNRQMTDIHTAVSSNVEEISQSMQSLTETMSREISQSGETTKQAVEEATKNMIDQNTKSLEGLKEQLDQLTSMKTDLSEKIHSEDVKCFRNIRATMDEQSKTQLEEDEKKHQQVTERFGTLEDKVAGQAKHMRVLVGITVVNCLGIIGIIAMLIIQMGLF